MFAEKLKNAMEDAGFNLTKLSAATGIGKSSISQYLSGKVEPPERKKEQLAIALGKETDFFKLAEINETITENNYNLPVKIASKLMGVSNEFLYQGLRDGRFPFGYAVKMSGRWCYYISPVMFAKHTGNPVPVRS